MDYSKFRSGSAAKGAAVSVNHKALITRALTKYPVDFALFRELLQNSADAQANSATIQFETPITDKAVALIHQLPIKRLRFENDGLDFTQDDWNRLREIASGNPNETKIGAFGVGFYSVFELTEEPLVHSGNQIMNFIYHGVQLHYYLTEKAPCYQKGTLIDLPYRKEGQLPDLVKFIGFLVQSFLLVNLNKIDLEVKYGDGSVVKLLSLSKTTEKPLSLAPPVGYRSQSPRKMLKMAHIQQSAVKIELSYLNASQMPPLSMSKGLFSFGKQLVSSLVTTSGNPEEYTNVSFDLTKVDAFVNVSVSSSYRNQMIETLLKPPPKQAVMSLLSFNGTLPSKSISEQIRSYIFPKDFNDAKIFIGFATKQSTGLKSHLALNQVIPTMERTAVDMSNAFVKDWNGEMLYMAGVMARCAYENELALCQAQQASVEDADFVISRFKFGSSAPDAIIGLYVKEGFWKCSNTTLVPTSLGILPNNKARIAGDEADLLRFTPIVVNPELAEELKKRGLVQMTSLEEIAADIGHSPVDINTAKKYMQWLVQKWDKLNDNKKVMLLSALRVKTSDGELIDIGSMHFYHDRSKLPDDEVASSLPPACLPANVSSELGIQNLSSLGMRPLGLEQWAKYRFQSLGPKNNNSAHIAEGVLRVSSKTWSRLAYGTRRTMRELFNSCPCIPTQSGLYHPAESYVKEIRIFPHLPIVDAKLELPSSWLIEIGVRESIDMAFVLEALSGDSLKWTNEDLVQYLEENSSSLKFSDWEILKNGRFFAEAGGKSLHRAKELYEPSKDLQVLGLPVISYKGWANSSSKQAKLLYSIGLRRFPPPKELFAKVKTSAESQVALRYFIRNYEEAGYLYKQIADLKVVPTLSGKSLAKPSECFRDTKLAAFGESVLDPSWEPAAARLGVRKQPKIQVLLERVLSDPQRYLTDPSQCDVIFSYFGQNASDFGEKEVKLCQNAHFLPIRRITDKGSSEIVSWETPASVFLPLDDENQGDDDILRSLLNTIRPSRNALPFLYMLGISDRPSLVQMVEIILRQPEKVFDLLKSGDMYEDILSRIESRWNSISQRPDLVNAMKASPFLLGIRYTHTSSSEDTTEEVSLYSASNLAIIDDISVFHQFKSKIVAAPQVDSLEKLYRHLGVRKLSEMLRESIKIGPPVVDEERKDMLQKRINERLQLFIENTSKQVNPRFKSVDIVFVKSLEIHRQLPPHLSVTTRTSACIHPNVPKQLLVVWGDDFDWIDVATSLVKLALVRPDQDSVVVLEIQLSSNLQNLEKKGYNVEKIRRKNGLHKSAKKVPVIREDVDSSPRQPQAQAQRAEIAKPHEVPSSKLPSQSQVQLQPQKPQQQPQQQPYSDRQSGESGEMRKHQQPAGRPVSQHRPQHELHQQTPNAPLNSQAFRSGMFNMLKNAISNMGNTGVESSNTKSPNSEMHQASINSGTSHQGNINSGTSHQGSNIDVNEQLRRGLQKGQTFTQNHISAPQNVDVPAPMRDADCNSPQKVHQLQYLASTENKMKIFSTAGSPQPAQDELLLSEALQVLTGVFKYPVSAVNIYRDSDVSSIAFNYNGSLFFNSCVVPNTSSILDYYYPVMAHELAHNLVSSHGASHSFYTESYMQTTLSNFIVSLTSGIFN